MKLLSVELEDIGLPYYLARKENYWLKCLSKYSIKLKEINIIIFLN